MLKTARIILCLSAALLLSAPSPAQETDKEVDQSQLPFRRSLFTGGSLGMQFGSVIQIDVSPQFGYYLLEHISVGTGFTYQYISDRRYAPPLSLNIYGGRLFTRLYLPVFDALFAHLEYEYMAYQTNIFSLYGQKEWITLHNFMAGVGYRQPIFGHTSLNLMVLWNFNESQYSLYSNPIIRVGVDVGL